MAEQKINAIMLIEVAGRPAEHLATALKSHVEKINLVKGVKIVNSKISEPRLLESEKDLYTSFSEVEVQADSLFKILDLVFDFMPSSIEIIEPADIELNCQEATMFMNDLAGRLHKYDEVTKIAQFQMAKMSAKIKELQTPQNQAPKSPYQPLKVSFDSTDPSTKGKNLPKEEKKKPSKKSKKK